VLLLQRAPPGAPPGGYAGVGAAAFSAASMRMPSTATVSLSECTRVDQGFSVPMISARSARRCAARHEEAHMTSRNSTGIQRYDAPAGGWGALKATAQAIADQMRIAEAPVSSFRTNKPDGFDCPGCAWPDKAHTSTFQFCENGAKAVTWEATKKRVTPEFFAAHTVTESSTWSDHDSEDAGRSTHPSRYDAATD
ncbi:hypothetical protein OY671_009341, partial [Metschnikowia pulcherrima]